MHQNLLNGVSPESVVYLRKGRKIRGTGIIADHYPNGSVKVKPARSDWKHVVITAAEIDAGSERPPLIHRKKPEEPTQPKPEKARTPKPVPLPRWKQLVDEVRRIEDEYSATLYPPIRMSTLRELADELERSQTLFQPTTP